MKKLYVAICALLFTTSILAQYREGENVFDKLIWDDKMLNIMLDTRVDFQTSLQNGDVNNAEFRGQTIRIWLAGEIVPGIRYRVRHRLNKPQDPLIRDNYSSATDQAWLAFDAGKHWTFTAGKQTVQLGTFEYDYNGADLYQSTMVNGDFDMYKTGVNVAYHFLGQTMNLQVVNSDAPQFARDDYKSKALAVNLMWQGSLLNNMVKTRWGYGAFQHSKTKLYNWLTLGTQLNIGKFATELDYFLGSRNMDYGSIVEQEDLGSRYVRDQSVALNLYYNLGKWKPALKGTWNQRLDKEFDNNAYESIGLQAALEFYPFEKPLLKDLRFHAAYVYNNTDYQGQFAGMGNKDTHLVLVGTRWLFKVK